jgi:hypothetical protein
MNSLELLFLNDKVTFIDSIKFEKLVKPLAQQITIHKISSEGNFVKYAENFVIPAQTGLFNLLQDEFMLKTFQYNVLKLGTRHESTQVRIAAAKLMLKVVDQFAQRYVVILNDFIPFLADMLDDEEAEVSVVSRNIVKALQQHTAEDIFKMIKNTQM